MGFAEAKFSPEIVTVVDVTEAGILNAFRYDTTGASKEKTIL